MLLVVFYRSGPKDEEAVVAAYCTTSLLTDIDILWHVIWSLADRV